MKYKYYKVNMIDIFGDIVPIKITRSRLIATLTVIRIYYFWKRGILVTKTNKKEL